MTEENKVKKELLELRQRVAELEASQIESMRVVEDLRKSEQKFRAIFKQTFQMTGLLAPDGTVIDVNQIALEFIGSDCSKVVGKPMWETPWLAHSQQAQERLRSAIASAASGKFERYEGIIAGADGTFKDMDFSVKPVRDDSGNIVFLIQEARDISGRKKMERALLESEQKFRHIFEQAFQMTGFLAPDGTFIDANQTALEFVQSEKSVLAGKPFWETPWMAHSSQEQERLQSAVKAAASGQFVRYEASITGADGSLQYIDFSLKPGRDDSGNIIFLIAEARDLTERKKMEVELLQSEQKFRDIFEQAFQMTGLLKLDGTVIDVNRVALEFFGLKLSEVAGVLMWETPWMAHSVLEQEKACAAVKAAASGRFVRYETNIVGADGSLRYIDFSLKPARDDSGKIIYLIPEARDLTERKEMEEGLRQSEHRYRTANKALEAFSYSISHDLRAPLRRIDQLSQVLLEDYGPGLDTQGKEYLQFLKNSSQRMGRLIDALLKLSFLTSSTMIRVPVNLSQLAREVAAELQDDEPDRSVDFIVTPGLMAEGDANLLRSVLENLLGNAWKFTGKRAAAKIEFGATEMADPENEEGTGGIVYFVRDNGAGFDMDYADKLFGTFQRLHSDSEFPGTGIGLAAVERIISRHGGRAWAEGAVDEGATVYFTLGENDNNLNVPDLTSGGL